MHIRVITPVTTEGFTTVDDFKDVARTDSTISVVNTLTGPPSIESHFDEVFALPGTLLRMLEAQAEGADAVVIDCMGDPGLAAGREVLDIPVVGASQGAMHLAAMLCHSFSVVTVLATLRPLFEDAAAVYGLTSKLASVRSVEIPVLELEQDPERLVTELADESVRAIEEDGAHGIVFGCTGMKGFAVGLRAELTVRGHAGVPVIDPTAAAVKLAESLVDLDLTHSRLSYATPRAKEVVGFDLPTPVGSSPGSSVSRTSGET